MEITPLLRKKPWSRIVNDDAILRPPKNATYYDIPASVDFSGVRRQYLTEFDLLSETTEGAHIINSQYYSQRPIYEKTTHTIEVPVLDENGSPIIGSNGVPLYETKEVEDWVITGYEDIEIVRSGLTEMICKQKVSHLCGNGIEIADEGGNRTTFNKFRAWLDISGVATAAWTELNYSCARAGDGALYIFMRGRGKAATIEYKVFSPLYGDMLFHHYDNEGNDIVVRLYSYHNRDMVDIYTTDTIETWIRAITEDSDNSTDAIVERIQRENNGITTEKSDDGWLLVSRKPSQLNEYTCQVIYLRWEDTPVGAAMDNINAWERGASYVSDKVRSTAFTKLFVKASKLKSLPALSSGEEVIGVENADADLLKASEASYLNPPDISNIATINLKNVEDAIMQSTMSIDLQPEILKSGADSSQTLKLLLRREIQWVHITFPKVRPAARRIIDVLKFIVAKIEGDEAFADLKISIWNTPWIPQDEDATADRVVKLLYAGVISQENARHELNLQYTDDSELVGKEAEDKIYRETYTKLKAEADARNDFGIEDTANDVVVDEVDDPNKQEYSPKIDNNASQRNKSVSMQI